MDRNKSSNEKINKKKDQTKQLAFLFMNFYCIFIGGFAFLLHNQIREFLSFIRLLYSSIMIAIRFHYLL